MRLLDSFPVRGGDYADEDDARRQDKRLRPFLALLITAGLAALLLLLFGPALGVVQAAGEFLWRHWPWALTPVFALVIGLPVWIYLEIANEHGMSEAPVGLAWFFAGSGAIVIALELDTDWNFVSNFLPGGPAGWSMFTVSLLAILFLFLWLRLRTIDDMVEDLYGGLIVIVGGCLLVAPIYVVGRWVAVSTPWAEAIPDGLSFLADHWSPIVLAFLFLFQVRWVRAILGNESRQPSPGYGSARRSLSAWRLVLIALTVTLVLYVALYYVPGALVIRDELSASEYSRAITDERRTLLAALAAVGAAVTLLYTHLRHQLDRDANATGRYTEAVQQVGADSMSIRLGGIYALSRVAKDSPDDRYTIGEVLAAFIRDGSRVMPTGVPLDVIAAIDALGQMHATDDDYADRNLDYEPGVYNSLNLRSAKLVAGNLEDVQFPRGVDLRSADMQAANLRSAGLGGANLSGANLREAIFSEAFMNGARCYGADAVSAVFDEAILAKLDFSKAKLQGASFVESDLTDADFENADLQNANFRDADLTGVSFRHAKLAGAIFAGAHVEDAVFYGTGLSAASLGDARSVSKAVFIDPESDDTVAQRLWRRRRQRRH